MTDLETLKQKLRKGALLVHLVGSDEWVLNEDDLYVNIGISDAERRSLMPELIAVSGDCLHTKYGLKY